MKAINEDASSIPATQSALSLHDHAARTHRAALCNLDSKVTHPSFVLSFWTGKRNGRESIVLEPYEASNRRNARRVSGLGKNV